MTTQFKSICTRCGAGIKNVCVYQGKHYGTTCVQLVSGISHGLLSYVRRNQGQDLDLDEYAEQLEQEEKAHEEKEEEYRKERELISQENSWLREVLYEEHYGFINDSVAINYNYDLTKGEELGIVAFDSEFIGDMYDKLEVVLFKNLSEKQKDILIDIYAKCFGRRNSKKYNAAYDYAFDVAYPD